MPRRIQNAPLPLPDFAARLGEGEELLWQGQPDPALFVWPQVLVGALLLLPILPMAFWLESLKTGAALTLRSPVTWVIMAVSWLVASGYASQEVRSQARIAGYALTNRRIFIRSLERQTSQDWRPRIDDYPLTTLRPRLLPLGGGRGSITFGFPLRRYELAFRGIADAAGVFARLTEARQALLGPEAETPYYQQKPTPLPSPEAAPLTDHLRRGERILWQGRMDPAQHWRSERQGLIGLIVLVSLLGGDALYLGGWWTPLRQALLTAGVSLVSYPLAWAGTRRGARGREYALTNQRVLVIKDMGGGRRSVEERELRETAGMRLARGRDGFGTIIFEKKTRWVWHGQGATRETYEFSFKHIPEAETVYARIAAARQ